MDDSIQTLKAEMNKLMSVYDDVKLKPEQANVAPDISVPPEDLRNKDSSTMITEAGREVLEVNFINLSGLREKKICISLGCW